MTAPKARTERSKKARLPLVVYLLGAAIFLLGTTEFMIAGLLPEMADDLDVSISQVGLLITGFAVGMLVGAPVMAVVTLRLPQRTTLGAALAVFAAGHVVSALASGFALQLVARFVTAVATGTFWAVAAVVVSTAAGASSRARGLSVLMGGLTVANVAGVPLGTLLGQTWGWRVPFWLLAGAAVVMAAGLLPLVPRAEKEAAVPRVRDEVAVFRRGRIWLALATIAVFQAGVFGTFSYLSPLLTDTAGLAEGAVPLVLALFGVGALIGVTLGGRLGDGWPWRTMFAGLSGVLVALLVIALFSHVAVLTVVIIGVLGVVGFTTAPPLSARVIGLAGPAPTLASASTTSAFNVGNSIGPWIGGIAITHIGLNGPAAIGVIAAAVAIGLTALSVRSEARTDPEGSGDEPAVGTLQSVEVG